MNWRVVTAFAAAGITPVLVSCVGTLVYAATATPHIGHMARFALPITILMAVPTAIGATLLIAVPAHFVASRLRRRSLRFYLLGSAAISIVVAILLILDIRRVPSGNDETWIFNALTVVIALVSGPSSAVVFWAVARPDRVNARTPDS